MVAALAIGWALFVGSLAQARHDNLRTNAFDLGYISQTLWNTAHGEPLRLTVLEGATFRPEGLDPFDGLPDRGFQLRFGRGCDRFRLERWTRKGQGKEKKRKHDVSKGSKCFQSPP